jgi:hypothetical protein
MKKRRLKQVGTIEPLFSKMPRPAILVIEDEEKLPSCDRVGSLLRRLRRQSRRTAEEGSSSPVTSI